MERLLFSEQKPGSTATTKEKIMRNGLNVVLFVACSAIFLIFIPNYSFAWNSDSGIGYIDWVAVGAIIFIIGDVVQFISGDKKSAQAAFVMGLGALIGVGAGLCFLNGLWFIGVILIPIAIIVYKSGSDLEDEK